MNLTFTSIETKKLFSSEHYSLLSDHVITETSEGSVRSKLRSLFLPLVPYVAIIIS